MKISPLNPNFGIGFTCSEQFENLNGYRYEKIGDHNNYHFTTKNFSWPEKVNHPKQNYKFDAFSPNLNKKLHVGHLRQLILAKSLSEIFANSTFVSMYGASQGVFEYALKGLDNWYNLASYKPIPYYDVLLPLDYQPETVDGEGEYAGCKIWQGPSGPVVIQRSNGQRTYASHDLIFSKYASPDFYITGEEQKSHFQSLGLGNKHLPMGLVLDESGKKCKSRTGDAMTAEEVLEEVQNRLRETPQPKLVAWNILAYNMLKVQRTKSIKYSPEKWCDPNGEGLYITYTLARLGSALKNQKELSEIFITENDLNQQDIDLLGVCSYYNYYLNRSIEEIDPCSVVNYLLKLSQQITKVYHKEKIKDGRIGLVYSCQIGYKTLLEAMGKIGMRIVNEV